MQRGKRWKVKKRASKEREGGWEGYLRNEWFASGLWNSRARRGSCLCRRGEMTNWAFRVLSSETRARSTSEGLVPIVSKKRLWSTRFHLSLLSVRSYIALISVLTMSRKKEEEGIFDSISKPHQCPSWSPFLCVLSTFELSFIPVVLRFFHTFDTVVSSLSLKFVRYISFRQANDAGGACESTLNIASLTHLSPPEMETRFEYGEEKDWSKYSWDREGRNQSEKRDTSDGKERFSFHHLIHISHFLARWCCECQDSRSRAREVEKGERKAC